MQSTLLPFAAEFLARQNIRTMVCSADDEAALSEMDLGLRRTILKESDARNTLFADLDRDLFYKNMIYFLEDRFRCHYVILPVPEEGRQVFLIGPYLAQPANIASTRELCEREGIPAGLTTVMNQYYSTIPLVDREEDLQQFIETMAKFLYGPGHFEIRLFRQGRAMQVHYNLEATGSSNEQTAHLLEQRYEVEQQMMEAIARGDIRDASRCNNSPVFRNLDDRAATSIRSRKNYMIVLNTLCRKAAQQGGVHPVYLDELSRQFAVKIEAVTMISQIPELAQEMVRKYCLLVQRSSTAGYSPMVGRVINYVALNLSDSEMTLSSVAQHFSVNKSYLTTMFRKEVGVPLTSYINEKRIEQAIFLLNAEGGQIQSIASACGIPDVTYFTRLFRRSKGMTPTEYKKMLRG